MLIFLFLDLHRIRNKEDGDVVSIPVINDYFGQLQRSRSLVNTYLHDQKQLLLPPRPLLDLEEEKEEVKEEEIDLAIPNFSVLTDYEKVSYAGSFLLALWLNLKNG